MLDPDWARAARQKRRGIATHRQRHGRPRSHRLLRRAAAAAAAQPGRLSAANLKAFEEAVGASGGKRSGKKGAAAATVINPQALELLVDGRDNEYTTPLNAHASGRRSFGCPQAHLLLNGMLFEVRPGDPVINPRHAGRSRACAVRRLQGGAAG